MPSTEVTQPTTDRPQTERFPLRAWLALMAMLVIIAAAGYLMYERVVGSSSYSRDLVEIAGSRRLPDFGAPRVVPDGIRPIGSNMYRVKAGEGLLTISKRREAWNFNFSYDKPDLSNADEQAAFTARFRLTRDAAFAKSLNVTEDQIKKLRELPPREGMVVSEPDRQRVSKLFDEYLQTPQPREQQTAALVQALREVAERSLPATRQTLAQRVREIQEILTPEQITRFKRPGN